MSRDRGWEDRGMEIEEWEGRSRDRGWEDRGMEIEDGKEEASRHRTEDTGMRQKERRLLPGPHVDGGPFIRGGCGG